ncbi:hypothetical protein BJ742DRAFT_535302 [Cladochytrium replicatum]|nr:hypothetical protein BJ742DRAFT_535302 [Cladochytrium replicatum]
MAWYNLRKQQVESSYVSLTRKATAAPGGVPHTPYRTTEVVEEIASAAGPSAQVEDVGISDRELSGGNCEVADWMSRLSRAGEAARTSFFLLLVAVTLLSIPMSFNCNLPSQSLRLFDEPPPIGPIPCSTCYANSVTLPNTVISWIFFTSGLAWFLLELVNSSVQSSAVIRLVIVLLGQPLIVSLFVLFFMQYAELKARTCRIGGE